MPRTVMKGDEHVDVVVPDFNAPLTIHLEGRSKNSETRVVSVGTVTRWGEFQSYVMADKCLQNQRCMTHYLYRM